MSAHVDKQYINKISSRLDGFVWKSGELANARCFVCGDSSVKKNKKRLYFICKDDSYHAYCHNCGYSAKIGKVLKQLDYTLYKEYTIESMSGRRGHTEFRKNNTEEKLNHGEYYERLSELPLITSLPKDHICRLYLKSRHLEHCFDTFRFCSKFKHWTNSLVPDKFTNTFYDEQRLVIPFFDEYKRFFAFTGRQIENKDGPRYILINLCSDRPLLYGLDRLDKRKKITVVEGPIDSTHLNNCIALAGSNISSLTSLKDSSKITIVFDNEPRHPDTSKKIESAINHGYDVCIWPTWVEHKDINSMICNGWDAGYIHDVINNNTYSGVEAKIRLAQWRKT